MHDGGIPYSGHGLVNLLQTLAQAPVLHQKLQGAGFRRVRVQAVQAIPVVQQDLQQQVAIHRIVFGPEG